MTYGRPIISCLTRLRAQLSNNVTFDHKHIRPYKTHMIDLKRMNDTWKDRQVNKI